MNLPSSQPTQAETTSSPVSESPSVVVTTSKPVKKVNPRDYKDRLPKKKAQSMLAVFQSQPKNSYILERMPLWGEKVSPEEINFSWPSSKEELDQTEVGSRLLTLKMKCVQMCISSVQCTFNDGTTSPVFEKAGVKHEMLRTLRFVETRRVHSAMACDNRGSDYVRVLWFFDEEKI